MNAVLVERAGLPAALPAFVTSPRLPPPRPPPAADVTRVESSGGATAGLSKLTVSLRAMPKPLQEMSEAFKGCAAAGARLRCAVPPACLHCRPRRAVRHPTAARPPVLSSRAQ